MNDLLSVRGLTVHYDAIRALEQVDLTVSAGEAVAVLGANGAGKTTLLRCLSGMVKKSSGSVIFDGQDVTGLRPAQLAKRGMIHVPEGRMIFSRLTVSENLFLGTRCAPEPRAMAGETDRVYDLFPRLAERRNQIAGSLSGGEQQMLAIGRGLLGRPKLLMLDEPSMGLSPLLVRTVFDALKEIRGTVTILLVEQNVNAALSLAERGYLLASGRVAEEGSSAALTSDSIRAAYLGE